MTYIKYLVIYGFLCFFTMSILLFGADGSGETNYKIIKSDMKIKKSDYQNSKEVIMSKNEVAQEVSSLLHWEIDYSHLLRQAIDNLDDEKLIDKISPMIKSTNQNIDLLEGLLRKYGKEPPKHTQDFKGYFMQGYASMRGLLSDSGVLNALHTNLQLSKNAFKASTKKNLPEEVKDVVNGIYLSKEKNLEDLKALIS